MTIPRRFLPEGSKAITRRCARRTFLLKPTPQVRAIVLYALAVALQDRKVAFHSIVVASNHFHLYVTDRAEPGEASDLPLAMGKLDSLVARALNAHYGRGENLWKTGSYDSVEIHNQASQDDQLLYLWTNPVKDGLVERPEDWPGLMFLPEDFGTTIDVPKPEGAFFGGRRPAGYAPTDPDSLDEWQAALAREEVEALELAREEREQDQENPPRKRRKPSKPRVRDRSTLPETVKLKIAPPPMPDGWSLEETRAHYRSLLDAEVERIHAKRLAAGKKRFLGVEAVLAQDPRESAGDTWPSFAINPRIACKGDTETRLQKLRELQEWRRAYRLAWLAWNDEDAPDQPFPLGTYQLLRWKKVKVTVGTGPPRRLVA